MLKQFFQCCDRVQRSSSSAEFMTSVYFIAKAIKRKLA